MAAASGCDELAGVTGTSRPALADEQHLYRGSRPTAQGAAVPMPLCHRSTGQPHHALSTSRTSRTIASSLTPARTGRVPRRPKARRPRSWHGDAATRAERGSREYATRAASVRRVRPMRGAIKPGSRVLVLVGGESRPGTLLRYVETPAGREARVRLDGETQIQDVATFAVSRSRRNLVAWWPDNSVGRAAIVTAVLAALALIPSYFTWLGGSESPAAHSTGRSREHPSASSSASTNPFASSTRPGPNSGQIEGGAIARIADITRGTGFSSALRARPCDVLLYRIRLYNPGSADLHHVRVAGSINPITPYKVIIPTIAVYAPDGDPQQVFIQPRIFLPKARTQSYVAGSTVMLNSTGAVVRRSATRQLSDAITTTGNGIDVGSVDVGITEFIDFRAKVNCGLPSPPVQ